MKSLYNKIKFNQSYSFDPLYGDTIEDCQVLIENRSSKKIHKFIYSILENDCYDNIKPIENLISEYILCNLIQGEK
jgi:hypothetical protein